MEEVLSGNEQLQKEICSMGKRTGVQKKYIQGVLEEFSSATFTTYYVVVKTSDEEGRVVIGFTLHEIKKKVCKLIVIVSRSDTKRVGHHMWGDLMKTAKSNTASSIVLDSIGVMRTRKFYLDRCMRDTGRKYLSEPATEQEQKEFGSYTLENKTIRTTMSGIIEAAKKKSLEKDIREITFTLENSNSKYEFIDNNWHLIGEKKETTEKNLQDLLKMSYSLISRNDKGWQNMFESQSSDTPSDESISTFLEMPIQQSSRRTEKQYYDRKYFDLAREWFNPRWNYEMTMDIEATSMSDEFELDEEFMRMLYLSTPTGPSSGGAVTVNARELLKTLFLSYE